MKFPKSEQCKRDEHPDCDGTIPRGFDEKNCRARKPRRICLRLFELLLKVLLIWVSFQLLHLGVEGVSPRYFGKGTSEQAPSPLRGGFPAASDHHQENEFRRWANHACKHVQLPVRGIGPICPTARAPERREPADRSGLLNSASYCCRNP